MRLKVGASKMIESLGVDVMSPYYEIAVNKILPNVWYTPKSRYYCVFEGYKPESDKYDFTTCYFGDYKNSKPLIKTRFPSEGFMLLAFLAQKENCKAVDLMELLTSNFSTKEVYVSSAKRIKLLYEYDCSVAFEGCNKDIFDEEIREESYAPTLWVKEKPDRYECYYAYYPDRSNDKIEEIQAVIYDKLLLYPFLLNERFDLLFDRAKGLSKS